MEAIGSWAKPVLHLSHPVREGPLCSRGQQAAEEQSQLEFDVDQQWSIKGNCNPQTPTAVHRCQLRSVDANCNLTRIKPTTPC